MIKIPYKYAGPLDPVVDEEICVPRMDILNQIIQGIIKGDYFVIVGPKQSGKTTFLRQIEHGYPDAHYLYFNLEIAPQREDDFYEWLIAEFVERIPAEKRIPQGKKRENGKSYVLFSQFLMDFKPIGDKRIVLFFDEIERLPFVARFLYLWRKVYHDRFHDKELLKYLPILTGSVDLIKFLAGPQSPYNIATQIYLRDFSNEESEKLITEPFKKLNVSMADNAMKSLISQLSGHPQMLQQTCGFLIETALEKGHDVGEKEIKNAIDYLLKSNSALNQLEQDITSNSKLRSLINDVFKGKKKKFFPFREFSIYGSGPIVADKEGYCTFRNKVYGKFLEGILSEFPYISTPPDTQGEISGDAEPLFLKKVSKNEYFDRKKKNALPYAIKQLRVQNYCGIIDASISGIPIDTQWIFLTGENGFGKTSVLQAIAIGLYGNRDGDTILTGEESKIGVELYVNGENQINIQGAPQLKPFTYFAAYGSSRLEIQNRQSANEISEKSTKTYGLFNTSGILLNIEYELLIWYLAKDPQFDIVKKILLELLPNIGDIQIINRDIVYFEKEGSGNVGIYEPLPYQKLASGYKSIIAMVGDMLIRFLKEQPLVSNPKELCGIVLIDELDLHLHPKWQRELPELFSRVFPKIQFIVSTHSVIPFLGAPKNSVFLKVTRNKKEGIQIQRINIDIKNLLPNSILTSPIFDLEGEDITQRNNKHLVDIRTEDNYKKLLRNNEIKKNLDAFEKSAVDFPDDLFDEE